MFDNNKTKWSKIPYKVSTRKQYDYVLKYKIKQMNSGL